MNHAIAPEGVEIPEGMRYCELPAEDETLQFWGRFLDSEDTDTGDSLRWAELRLYRIVDTNPDHDDRLPVHDESKGMFGKQMWLLYTVGHSLIYHDPGASCKGGKLIPAGDFESHADDSSELTGCPDCSPQDWETVGSQKLFRLEVPWYSYTPCQSPQKVIRSLHRRARCRNCGDGPHDGGKCRRCWCDDYQEAPRTLSVPGRALLEKVAKLDPEIAQAMAKVKRL